MYTHTHTHTHTHIHTHTHTHTHTHVNTYKYHINIHIYILCRYLRVGAKLNYGPALYHLGARYLTGESVEKSEPLAITLWRRAGYLYVI